MSVVDVMSLRTASSLLLTLDISMAWLTEIETDVVQMRYVLRCLIGPSSELFHSQILNGH